MTNTCC